MTLPRQLPSFTLAFLLCLSVGLGLLFVEDAADDRHLSGVLSALPEPNTPSGAQQKAEALETPDPLPSRATAGPASDQSEVAGEVLPEIRGRWLRIADVPQGEPDLPSLESRLRADFLTTFWELSFEQICDELDARAYDSRDAIYAKIQEARQAGKYDVISTDGVEGTWGIEDLPEHYKGALWQGFGLQNGTAEVVRLSPLDFEDLYREHVAVDVLRELRDARHNRPELPTREAALQVAAEYRAAGRPVPDRVLRRAGLSE